MADPQGASASTYVVGAQPGHQPHTEARFAVVACTLLCLLFPVALVLLALRWRGGAESGLTNFANLLGETFLYGATFSWLTLGGVLCEANTLLIRRCSNSCCSAFGAADFRRSGILRRLRAVFRHGQEIQSDDRHCRRQLRPDDSQSRAENRHQRQPSAIILPQALVPMSAGSLQHHYRWYLCRLPCCDSA